MAQRALLRQNKSILTANFESQIFIFLEDFFEFIVTKVMCSSEHFRFDGAKKCFHFILGSGIQLFLNKNSNDDWK